jgi:ABC-type lipoprotein release transport system permease subunit
MRRSLAGAHGFLMSESAPFGLERWVFSDWCSQSLVCTAWFLMERLSERGIGIRMALGRQLEAILGIILRQGVWMVFLGMVAGLAGALGMTQLLARFLLLVSPFDPLTFVTVTLILAVVALSACYIPARRAMRVEPVEALRHE